MTSKNNKMFAETMYIKQPLKQIGDYVYEISEKDIADIRETWNDFILDELYNLYQKEGITHVLQISREDYKKFLEWALPKYKEETSWR